MTLSDRDRQRIYEEEKARIEARELVQNELNAKKFAPGKFLTGCVAILLIPLGLIILGVVGALIGTNPSKSTTQHTEQQTTQAKLESESNRIVEVIIDNKKKRGAWVDETIHVIERIEHRKRLGNEFANETADGEFLIVRLIVRNDSKATRTIGASFMTIIDAQGHEFSTSSNGCMALAMGGDKSAELLLTEVQPGLQKKISVVFDIPPGLKNLKLKVPSGILGSPVYLPI